MDAPTWIPVGEGHPLPDENVAVVGLFGHPDFFLSPRSVCYRNGGWEIAEGFIERLPAPSYWIALPPREVPEGEVPAKQDRSEA